MMGGALGKMGMSADQLADMEDEVNQMIANGEQKDLWDARSCIYDSFEIKVY